MKSKLILPVIIITLFLGIFVGHSTSSESTSEGMSLSLFDDSFKEKAEIDEDRAKAIANINDQITILKAEVQILNSELETVKEKSVINTIPPALKVPEKKITIPEKPKEIPKQEEPVEKVDDQPKAAKINSPRSHINMRAGPGTNHSVVTKVSQDQTFTILTEENEWYKVRLSDGQVGWIARWIVKPVGN